MDASYVKPFIESTKAVFSTMLSADISFGHPYAVASPPRFDVSGIIGMTGDVVGAVVLSLPTDVARKMVAKFTSSPVDESSEDFADAIGEIVNMISGGAKAQFKGKSVSISCPSVVVGPGHTVKRPSNTPCISIPCKSVFGDFSIDVSIRPETASKAAA
jgi:chemotaxis protein CheX